MNKNLVSKLWPQWLYAVACALFALSNASAEPLLPYAAPIAAQLSNDVSTLQATSPRSAAQNHELQTDIAALKTYRQSSATRARDIGILRHMVGLLRHSPSYFDLLDTAINDYLADFQEREAELRTNIYSAPLSEYRSHGLAVLDSISHRISTNEFTRLRQLQPIGVRLDSAARIAVRAGTAPVRKSIMRARIGHWYLISHATRVGGSLSNGVLYIAATNPPAIIKRRIELHLTNVTDQTPATYLLGTNGNDAVYTAIDHHRTEFVFHSIPGPTNHPSSVTIETITPRYIIGRFNFRAEITEVPAYGDTNLTTRITNGLFQLNL